MSKGKKISLYRGLTASGAALLALSVSATTVVNDHRTDIDKFLGTSSTKIVTDEDVDTSDMYTYSSDYSNTTELVSAIADVGERMSEEGSVLLKNNGALPLSADETKKVSLLGFSSYYPVQGGDMGSSLTVNVGTDADTVDFVGALTAKGFVINTELQNAYEKLKETFKTEVENWGGTSTYYNITAPSIGAQFTSKEPSIEALNGASSGWKDSLASNNIMIVTIARSGSENKNYTPGQDGVDSTQNLNQTDPLGLSDDERNLIQAAIDAKNVNGGKVIVILNNSSAMEVQELQDNEGVDAILQVGLPGGYGFYGVADILSGEVNPSGHLTDTYAVVAANSPAAQNYGDLRWTNADDTLYINDALVEAEGIYTGYKYYETRYADVVLGQGNASDSVGSSTGSAWNYADEVTYTFGYGLSYTTFEQVIDSIDVDTAARKVTAKVTVTNTGDTAGKDAVQLYVSLPYTQYDIEHGIEKSAIQLLDFGKTEILEPGASETVTIEADMDYMTSWDSTASNATGTTGSYILDEGDYYFTVGNGAHEALNNVLAAQGKTVADGMTEEGNAENVKIWTLSEFDGSTFATTKNGTAVENQLSDMDLNNWLPGTVTYLTRNDWAGTWPKTYEGLTATDEMLEILDNDTYEITANGDPSSVVFGADNGLKLADLKGVTDVDDERWDLLVDQITLSEALIRTGFGGTSTKTIDSISSPEVIQNDGANGIYSYPLSQYANTDTSSSDPCAIDANDKNASYKAGVMANATVIAQTFSKKLASEYGAVMGNYSLWSNLTIWWGVSNNIHRLPYNARNHEYYSEDPVLSSFIGLAEAVAAQKYGVIVATKHLAFNDTEVNRSGVAVFMTEQKAREQELRATQAPIESGKVLGVMTAFNRVGLTPANAHSGLLNNILHNEWGFYGLMSED
ncbi:MAG: glycoside hydrolase family 3 C-terminal domain-containing protein, partial [Lachnospiraceae bacterium]|nr:glycoside hydrolase family 3 C-terminal domain-containing protein [Lachnospiraceae bacterium]